MLTANSSEELGLRTMEVGTVVKEWNSFLRSNRQKPDRVFAVVVVDLQTAMFEEEIFTRFYP
jgi:hypothetical protein